MVSFVYERVGNFFSASVEKEKEVLYGIGSAHEVSMISPTKCILSQWH